jgi:peptide/nickel transport system permease protein
MRRAGWTLLGLLVIGALGAPWLAPNPADLRFRDFVHAPPTRLVLFDDVLPVPHIHPHRIVSRLERTFAVDDTRHVRVRVLHDGRLVSGDAEAGAPLLLLGADGYGRDVLARLLYGAQPTLALALAAALASTLVGAWVGGLAGYLGGWVDAVLSRSAELVLVLPAMYVALALRAVMPLVLPASTVFVLLLGIFVVFGWPIVARSVRAVVVAERDRDYVIAARASGARGARVLTRHLLPAAIGFAAAQATLLVPAFVVAEATLSSVGLGFPDSTPTWGTMLQETANVSLVTLAPWMLAPAFAIFVLVLAINLLIQGTGRPPVQLDA